MSQADKQIKQHFESEAPCYEDLIPKLIPGYGEMIAAVVESLPFSADDHFQLIDFGCGTGTLSAAVLKQYPQCSVTALDFSGAMIQEAKKNLLDFDVRFVTADFSTWDLDRSYDAMVSSLALHHLPTNEAKKEFYQHCYHHLNKGGVFCNADVILASRPDLQEKYMVRWKAFQRYSVPEDEIENHWLVKYREEDVPAKMSDHLHWMGDVGFNEIDILWKYYNFAVYCGYKS